MKSTTIIILLFFSLSCFAQDLTDLSNRLYSEQKDLKALDGFIEIEARVDLDRYICRYFLDTTSYKRVFIIEKEVRTDSTLTFKILAVLSAPPIKHNELVVIGSYEGVIEKEDYRFVVAIEHWKSDSRIWPIESKRIKKIWTFSTKQSKFIELKGRKFKRYGEGYH